MYLENLKLFKANYFMELIVSMCQAHVGFDDLIGKLPLFLQSELRSD